MLVIQVGHRHNGVAGNGQGEIQLATNSTGNNSGRNLGDLEWYNSGASSTRAGYLNVSLSGTDGTSTIGSYMAFGTKSDGTSGAAAERMRITNTGNLGINDISPGTKLSVVGNAQVGYSSGQTAPANGLIVSGSLASGTTTPVANFQIANGTNATTTVEFGSAGQNKGTCIKLYRTDGSAIYASVAAGATTFTLSTSPCASVGGF